MREALARAAFERSEAEGGLRGQFLEVRGVGLRQSKEAILMNLRSTRLKILKSLRRNYC